MHRRCLTELFYFVFYRSSPFSVLPSLFLLVQLIQPVSVQELMEYVYVRKLSLQMCSTLYFELEPCSLYIITFPQNTKGAEAQNSKLTIKSCAHRMLRLLTFILTSASFVFQDRTVTIITTII